MAISFMNFPRFFLLLFAMSSLFAQNKDQKSEVTCKCICPGYNAPSQIEVCQCRDFFVTGSFTYWQPTQENMALGLVGDISNSLDVIQGYIVNLDFDFKPGFQLGAGMNLSDDQWDIYLQYTWFRGNEYASKDLDPNNDRVSLYPSIVKPYVGLSSYFFGKEKWTLDMDLLDAELGRRYYVGKKLTFRPFIGLRTPFIRQRLEVDYLQNVFNPTDNLQIRSKFNSWGIGPRTGICLDWDLGWEFRLYGKGAADIAFTQYSNYRFLQQNVNAAGQVQENSRYKIKDSLNFLRPHMDLAMGFGWGRYLFNNKWHFDFSMDYSFQVFFSQNLFRCFVDDQSYVNVASHGDMYIQGFTATCRADF